MKRNALIATLMVAALVLATPLVLGGKAPSASPLGSKTITVVQYDNGSFAVLVTFENSRASNFRVLSETNIWYTDANGDGSYQPGEEDSTTTIDFGPA